MSDSLTRRCGVCGFDRSEWTAQDLRRTLVHADALIAGWSLGAPETVRTAIAGVTADPDGADHVGAAADVHRLWHRLVSIADVRRAQDDVIASQLGSVAQISRSDGGVPKRAVESADVDRRGIVGDVQATRVHHGRPWQALCLWSADVIDALVREGHPIGPGAAGENITIRGVDWASLRGGAIIDVGSVRCQLSAPAEPCSKNKRWFIDGDIRRMDHDLHPGWSRWYASIVTPGSIRVGDAVVVEPSSDSATADLEGNGSADTRPHRPHRPADHRHRATVGEPRREDRMNPTELHTLFSSKEQTLLVATERARLKEMAEDDLDELLTLVRRARNKYTKLYRRQSADLVAAKSSRAGTSTSNQRTKRKAEIFEDALARVATALGAAARATSNELKQERLAAASAAKGTPAVARARSSKAGITGDQPATARGGNTGGAASKSRRASNNAQGSRRQAKRDSR